MVDEIEMSHVAVFKAADTTAFLPAAMTPSLCLLHFVFCVQHPMMAFDDKSRLNFGNEHHHRRNIAAHPSMVLFVIGVER